MLIHNKNYHIFLVTCVENIHKNNKNNNQNNNQCFMDKNNYLVIILLPVLNLMEQVPLLLQLQQY